LLKRHIAEDLIGNLKVQLLQAQGAMTCCGLLEEAAWDVIYKNDLSEQMPISDALLKLDEPYAKWQKSGTISW